ncbi:MAG: hypothetical protein V3W51_02345 [Candidatus Brocadiales bacterium]
MLELVNCPVCHEEIGVSEEMEAVQAACPACGKAVTPFICPYCGSEFTPTDIGETKECPAQET